LATQWPQEHRTVSRRTGEGGGRTPDTHGGPCHDRLVSPCTLAGCNPASVQTFRLDKAGTGDRRHGPPVCGHFLAGLLFVYMMTTASASSGHGEHEIRCASSISPASERRSGSGIHLYPAYGLRAAYATLLAHIIDACHGGSFHAGGQKKACDLQFRFFRCEFLPCPIEPMALSAWIRLLSFSPIISHFGSALLQSHRHRSRRFLFPTLDSPWRFRMGRQNWDRKTGPPKPACACPASRFYRALPSP